MLAVGIGGITFSGTNKIEFKLTHSDDDATYTPVTLADMLGLARVETGGIVKALTAAHAAAGVYRCGYVGGSSCSPTSPARMAPAHRSPPWSSRAGAPSSPRPIRPYDGAAEMSGQADPNRPAV